MAIAIEGTPQTYTDGAAGTGDLSGNFTVTSGMDGVIVCAGNRSGTTHTCTLNGVALQLDLDFVATRHVQIWRMATADMPAPGTYTLAYTTNGDRARAVAFGMSGHDDSGGPELTDTNSGSSTSLSGDLGSAPSSGAMSIMVGHRSTSVTFSATDGTIAAQLNEAAISLVSLYSINNQTLAATASSTGNWDTATVAYPEASAGTAQELAGTAAGVGSAAGGLSVSAELGGASSGVAAASGGASVVASVAGSSSGSANATGALALSTSLAGTGTGLGGAAGDLSVDGTTGLVGSVTGDATVAGAIDVAAALSGSVGGAASGTGDLTVPGQELLAGLAAGSSSASGDIAAAVAIAGSSSGAAAAVGQLERVAELAGVATGASSATGAMVVAASLGGVASGVASVAGGLAAAVALSGAAAGVAAASGDLGGDLALDGIPTIAVTFVPGLRIGITRTY
jgi:hypothetical protein